MKSLLMATVMFVLALTGCRKADEGPSVKAIVAEWKANKAATEAKYGGKPLSIQGQFTGAYNDSSGLWINISVPEADGPMNKNVKCYLDAAAHEKAKKLPTMAITRAKGTFGVDGAYFVLKSCTLEP